MITFYHSTLWAGLLKFRYLCEIFCASQLEEKLTITKSAIWILCHKIRFMFLFIYEKSDHHTLVKKNIDYLQVIRIIIFIIKQTLRDRYIHN